LCVIIKDFVIHLKQRNSFIPYWTRIIQEPVIILWMIRKLLRKSIWQK